MYYNLFNSGSTTITDLPELLPLMKKNVEENKKFLVECDIKAAVLKW